MFSDNTTLSVEPAMVPVVNISTNPGTAVAAGQSVTFTAIVAHGGSHPSYQWVVNSTRVSGATNATYTTAALSNHDSVSCIVESACGLTGFNSVGVSVRGSVGVNNVTAANSNLTLVPNPNKGNFTVKGNLAATADQDVTMEVTNVIGQVVYSAKVVAHGGTVNEHITLNNLANGMYILNLRSGEEKAIFHFVIEQ